MKKLDLLANKIHPSLIEFWASNGTQLSDMYCRDCGELMLDLDDLKDVEVICDTREGKGNKLSLARRHLPVNPEKSKKHPFAGTHPYIPNETNRWLVNGKNLAGKMFYRRICWNCFFKKLRAEVDIPKKARKSTWYQKLLDGENPIPIPTMSPSPIFKFLFDITDDELNKERKKFDTASLESFIKRHGEKEGRKKFEAYSKRQSYTCSKEYMMNEKGMTEAEWHEFNQNRATTKKNLVRRYGKELGEKKWKEYCEKEAYAGNALEYFIDKYGQEDGTRKYLEVNAKKQITLSNFVKKYGLEEGTKRFNSLKLRGYSTRSQELFIAIDETLGDLAKDSFYAIKNEEKILEILLDDKPAIVRPDYILGTKIIEFNGDLWHANPRLYKAGDVIRMPYSDNSWELVDDIWEKDTRRNKAIEAAGYKIHVVWEYDFVHDFQNVVQQCCEFLKG